MSLAAPPTGRPGRSLIALAVVAVVAIAGCCSDCGEPGFRQIYVRNDSGSRILIRAATFPRVEIGPSQTRYLSASFDPRQPALVTIINPDTCTVRDTVSVVFSEHPDPLVIVPASGSATTTDRSRSDLAGGEAPRDWNDCLLPKDGWAVSITNPTSTAYVVAAYSDRGRLFGEAAVPPGVSETFRTNGDLVEGTIALLDSECHPLDAAPHNTWGNYVATISDDKLHLEPGDIPDEPVAKIGNGLCPALSPGPTFSVPALTWTDAQVFVVPAHGLHDLQTVRVTVNGFGIGGKVWLSECSSESAVSTRGCGAELAAQTLVVTDDNRNGSADFIVHATAADGSLRPATTPCTNQCVIVATMGVGYAFGYAPIFFTEP